MTRRLRGMLALLALASWLAGCATSLPPTVTLTPQEQYEPEEVSAPTMLVEYPPIEAVEPPPLTSPAAPSPSAAPGSDAVALAAPSASPGVPPPTLVPESNTDDQQLIALLGDLQRFGNLSADELKRELAIATQALAKQRNDINRVRLAVLYSLSRASPQDDQRALQLLDNVAKGAPGPASVKQLALVLQAQIAERMRAVRDEQQRAEAAVQKLEALRQMERSLMRDRSRGGGGVGGVRRAVPRWLAHALRSVSWGEKPACEAVVRRATRRVRVNESRSGSWPDSRAMVCISHRMA